MAACWMASPELWPRRKHWTRFSPPGESSALDGVLELHVEEDELVKRLLQRGRTDDQPEVIRRRFQAYVEQTRPLLAYYRQRGLLHTIEGTGSPDAIFARIQTVLDRPRP